MSLRGTALAKLLRRLPPRLPGKQRLARALLSLAAVDRDAPCWIEARDGLRFHLPNLREPVAFELFISGVVEPETIAFLASRIRPGTRMLDIGANLGGISLPLARQFADLCIDAIEAAPRVHGYLCENIAANALGARLKAHQMALSDEPLAEIEFYSPQDHFGKGSLGAVFTDQGVRVPNRSLQALVSSLPTAPQLIKIDVEGYERQVLSSGESYLRDERPQIVFEFCDWAETHAGNRPGDSQRLLLDLGYRIARITQPEVELRVPLEQGFDMLWASPRG
mgnify:CR=1 FL=1